MTTIPALVGPYAHRPQHAARRHQPSHRYPVGQPGRARHRRGRHRLRRPVLRRLLGSATVGAVALLTAWPQVSTLVVGA